MRPLLAASCFCGALLAACGKDEPPAPAPPAPPRSPDPATTAAATPRPPGSPAAVTITQILILYKPTREVPKPRTRDEAYALAKSLIESIRRGTRMEMLMRYTDDRDENGKPYNDGSVSLGADSPAMPAIKRAAFSTPIGEVAPEPVDSGSAFVVIRRDA